MSFLGLATTRDFNFIIDKIDSVQKDLVSTIDRAREPMLEREDLLGYKRTVMVRDRIEDLESKICMLEEFLKIKDVSIRERLYKPEKESDAS